MRIVSAALGFTLLFLAIALSGSMMVFWGVAATRSYTDRMNLARQSYEQHLLLSTHTYQLFKQYGDALLIGDRDNGAGEAEMIALIEGDLAAIRSIIEAEIAMVGEEEEEELEVLDELEATIRKLVQQFEARPAGANVAPLWGGLSDILDNEIDQDFRALMDGALAEELEEVVETQAELDAEMRLIRRLALGFAAVAIIAALAGILVYRRRVHRRLVLLMDGVSAFERGDLSRRIATTGKDEIADMARLLNNMGGSLQSSQAALMDQNAALEDAVLDRTVDLRRLLDDARTAEKERQHLLADVSHELRTPLTIIQGESDVALRSAKTPQEFREALTRTRNAANHTASLVDDLMTIARKEAGALELRLEPTELTQFLRDVVDLFPKPVTLEMGIANATAPVDKLRLRQALLALLNNAVLHGGPNRWLRLTETSDAYTISVIDDGDGLSDQDKAHVFERFFRGSNAAGNYSEGTGLGVPIVKAIAEGHGGYVVVTDRPGGGAEFSIFIPKRPND